MKTLAKQQGFTLIEALIAFAVLTVGLLGALLFHSTLVSESSDTKARTVAVKIAEQRLEELRDYSDFSEFSSTIVSMASAGIPAAGVSAAGVNANYTVSYSFSDQSASSAENLYQGTVTVSWNDVDGTPASVALSTNIAWINPIDELEVDQAGVGNASANLGSIKPPTGTATAVDRVPVVNAGGDQVGTVVDVAISGDNTTKGVVAEDGNIYKLVDIESTEHIFSIVGTIVNDNNPGSTVSDPHLGYLSDATINSGAYSSVIDVRATGGANCIVYYVNAVADPQYAHFKCLAGEGWSGNVNLTVYPPPADSGGEKQLLDNTGVCKVYSRRYKYYIVQPADQATFSLADRSSSVSVAGESGLVRFGNADTEEPWDSYFWHHPQVVSQSTSVVPWGALEPGDIWGQSFIISDKTNTDCDDFDTSNSVYNVASAAQVFPSANYASSAAPSFDFWPGGFDNVNNESNYGVTAEAAGGTGAGYGYTGNVILGYVIAYTSVTGTLTPASGATSVSDYSVRTSIKEPAFNQDCTVSSDTGVITYSCSVPTDFGAAIVAESLDNSLLGCPETTNGPDPAEFLVDGVSLASGIDNIAFHLFSTVSEAGVSGQDFTFLASAADCSGI